jgi:hypothetical protein
MFLANTTVTKFHNNLEKLLSYLFFDSINLLKKLNIIHIIFTKYIYKYIIKVYF